MSYTINVKILDKENTIKYLPYLRKWTTKSISEIRDIISKDDFILVSEHTKNPQSLIDLKQHILDLENKGAKIKIIMNTTGYLEEINMDMIATLIKRRKEIDKEVDEIWDLETREDDDSE